MDAPMYVKSRAVMVRARFLRPQGSLCDRCATALRAALDLGASAGPGQAEAGAGSACPKSAARRRRLALELAKQLVDLADQVALQHPAQVRGGLALEAVRGQISTRRWVVPEPIEDDHVQGPVGLPVPAAG